MSDDKPIEDIVCDELGGSINIREFEDRYNPLSFKADIKRLGITKNYVDYISDFYERHIYNKILSGAKQVYEQTQKDESKA